MAKQNNHNDPIENLFRKKAKEYDISFKEKDWQALEEKLDHHQAIISYKRRIRWVAAAALLLVSTLGYFTYQNYNKIDQLAQQLNEETTSQNQSDSESDPQENFTQINPDLSEGVETTELKDAQDTSPLSNDQIAEPTSELTDISENLGDENFTSVSYPISTADSVFITDVAPVESPTLASPPPTNEITENDAPTEYNNTQPASSHNSNSPRVSSTQLSGLSRFEIGVVLSPDLSTAGGVSNFYEPGYKFGITIGYQLTENISLSSGIMHSRVNYSAQSNDYSAPYSPGNNSIVANQLLAECNILDIPIGLKYNFLNSEKSRFFSSASLSTYIMLNEDFEFNYVPERGPQQQLGQWNEQSGKAHFMSNLGLSIGYEYDLHSNLSLRAEPFIRVPLKEVGWGNVKLYSMGTFISVNYRL